MNYIKPEDIKEYVSKNPEGIAGMSEELAVMVNHFAELIVAECMDQVWYTREDGINGNVSEVIKDRIKQHFGVDGMSTEDKKTLIKELLGVKE